MAVGYLAGRWRETYDIVSVWVPPLLTGALCIVVAATYAAMQLMLGVDATVSLLVVREIVVQGILGADPRAARSSRWSGGSCARRWSMTARPARARGRGASGVAC